MEPLETPIKDGILYQQHVKFGKVGTPAARQLPRTVGVGPSLSSPGPGRMGKESGWGTQPRCWGVGRSPILSLSGLG